MIFSEMIGTLEIAFQFMEKFNNHADEPVSVGLG